MLLRRIVRSRRENLTGGSRAGYLISIKVSLNLVVARERLDAAQAVGGREGLGTRGIEGMAFLLAKRAQLFPLAPPTPGGGPYGVGKPTEGECVPLLSPHRVPRT